MQPTDDDFRALARSAPWLFMTMHFSFRRRDGRDDVEAWLSRPGGLRVRTADGVMHDQSTEPGMVGWRSEGNGWTKDIRPVPQQLDPPRRRDGLVDARPEDPFAHFDDPMWGAYDWVAMLDPVELSHHTTIRDLEVTERQGRETWWAEVAADEGYAPRCGCCPLLWGELSERDEGAAGGPTWVRQHPEVEYPNT